jgi:secondary thiamine-phosphate synthase enzyme
MMQFYQKEIQLKPFKRGFHIVTDEITNSFKEITQIKKGELHVFIKHTSASLTINENADKSVRNDFEFIFSKLIPENDTNYTHTFEGDDDMPAHIKTALLGCSVVVPITNGKLNLGTWQGIYLCEHRNYGGNRTLVLTAFGI